MAEKMPNTALVTARPNLSPISVTSSLALWLLQLTQSPISFLITLAAAATCVPKKPVLNFNSVKSLFRWIPLSVTWASSNNMFINNPSSWLTTGKIDAGNLWYVTNWWLVMRLRVPSTPRTVVSICCLHCFGGNCAWDCCNTAHQIRNIRRERCVCGLIHAIRFLAALQNPLMLENLIMIFLEGCAYCTGSLTAALSADCPGWSVLSPDCIGTGPADLDASPLSAPVSWLAAGSLSWPTASISWSLSANPSASSGLRLLAWETNFPAVIGPVSVCLQTEFWQFVIWMSVSLNPRPSKKKHPLVYLA